MFNLDFGREFCSVVSENNVGGTSLQGNGVYQVGSAVSFFYEREHIRTIYFVQPADALDFIGREMSGYGNCLSWDAMRELYRAGFTVDATPPEQLSYNQVSR